MTQDRKKEDSTKEDPILKGFKGFWKDPPPLQDYFQRILDGDLTAIPELLFLRFDIRRFRVRMKGNRLSPVGTQFSELEKDETTKKDLKIVEDKIVELETKSTGGAITPRERCLLATLYSSSQQLDDDFKKWDLGQNPSSQRITQLKEQLSLACNANDRPALFLTLVLNDHTYPNPFCPDFSLNNAFSSVQKARNHFRSYSISILPKKTADTRIDHSLNNLLNYVIENDDDLTISFNLLNYWLLFVLPMLTQHLPSSSSQKMLTLVKKCETAAKEGNGLALILVACQLADEKSPNPNLNRALTLYREAVAKGYALAKEHLKLLVAKYKDNVNVLVQAVIALQVPEHIEKLSKIAASKSKEYTEVFDACSLEDRQLLVKCIGGTVARFESRGMLMVKYRYLDRGLRLKKINLPEAVLLQVFRFLSPKMHVERNRLRPLRFIETIILSLENAKQFAKTRWQWQWTTLLRVIPIPYLPSHNFSLHNWRRQKTVKAIKTDFEQLKNGEITPDKETAFLITVAEYLENFRRSIEGNPDSYLENFNAMLNLSGSTSITLEHLRKLGQPAKELSKVKEASPVHSADDKDTMESSSTVLDAKAEDNQPTTIKKAEKLTAFVDLFCDHITATHPPLSPSSLKHFNQVDPITTIRGEMKEIRSDLENLQSAEILEHELQPVENRIMGLLNRYKDILLDKNTPTTTDQVHQLADFLKLPSSNLCKDLPLKVDQIEPCFAQISSGNTYEV